MEFSPETIFISYSRADGREFAEAFERRLEHEGIRSWRDLKSMEAGDIRLSNGKQSGPRIGMQKGPLTGVGTGLSR